MFPDIARDDVFRLETERLWLRWPRAADAAGDRALLRPIGGRPIRPRAFPHPYPPGARRALHLRRARGNALGSRPDARADAASAQPRDAIGVIGLEGAAHAARLTLGYCARAGSLGQGLVTEAARAVVDLGFALTARGRDRRRRAVENPASRRVLEKVGFAVRRLGVCDGAPARGGDGRVRALRVWRAARLDRVGAARGPTLTSETGDP